MKKVGSVTQLNLNRVAKWRSGRIIRSASRGVAALGFAALAVGCSATDEFLFDRSVPDEFAVVSRAPLSLPPNFDLRPPAPGAIRPQEADRDRETQIAVFGGPANNTDRPATGEEALLSSAGAVDIDPNIRQVVEQETAEFIANDSSFVDYLVFWRNTPQPGEVIDPTAERARISAATALGDPVTGEGAPVIERRRSSPLEGIFN